MYINDVIRQVKKSYPSEYDEGEMYVWCNEVSSMLAVEDRNVFREIYLSTDRDGGVLLPENVEIENIECVECDGRRLAKKSFSCRNRRFDCGAAPRRTLRIVYAEPYRPIRLTRYRGEIEINSTENYIRTDACEFLQGDTLNIGTMSNGGAMSELAANIPLIGVDYDTQGYILHIPKGSLPDVTDGTFECVITRVITEKTVCAAPYDSMYIDYILAKINLYQRDTEAYNVHMTAFNSRLSAYKRWLINHMPPSDSRLENWW